MASQSPQPKPSLLQRLRQRLARIRGGDVIITTIGPGASDNVVGKNIIKIGTLVVPALPAVVALLVVLVSGVVGLWLYLVPAKMPAGYFNVAVAEFSQVDGQGRERVTADSALISKTLFATIQGELEQLPPDYQAVVWHDSMNLLQKRTTIGAIESTPKQDRSSAACQRATDLNADMIVYGTLDASANPAQLRLQFCVRNTARDRDMGNLQELQKVDRLGGPLSVVLPLNDVQSSVNPPLRVRTALLAKLVVGLRYELATNPNFQFSLNKALGVFTDALDYLEKEGGATRDNGGDLVYYFIGRENFLLFQDSATPEEKKPGHLDAARDTFARAVELNPLYARASSSLGAVYFLKARQNLLKQQPATHDLSQGISSYQAAILAAQAEKDQSAEAEARLALAHIYWLQADSYLRLPLSDITSAEFALVQADQQIELGDALIQPSQNRLRGFAAMVRGLVAHERAQMALRAGDKDAARAHFLQAREFYNQCIAAGKVDPGDQFLKRQIITFTCTPKEANVAAALQGM
jgi:hypothetical protein